MARKKVGIVGYGHLGQYLTRAIENSDDLSLAFVWNRSLQSLEGHIEESLICRDLESCSTFGADLIVEVAHPIITELYGEMFLENSDYMVGSPTVFATRVIEEEMRRAASKHGHGVYIPAGALWGGEDIAKMADQNTLKGLKITMKKHPSCFKLQTPLKELNDSVTDSPVILYEGSVGNLCPLAPNNVNTMAAGAIAAHNLGFGNVQGCLVSDPSLVDWHVVEVEVTGPSTNGNAFGVTTVRRNPANVGAVTGSATYGSFFSSLKRAGGKGPGIHLC